MPASALELRPRGPVALLDAAIRLCARTSGVWALTLPAGALLTAALLGLFDALDRQKDLLWPCAFLTLAWIVRGVLQGAACHLVERQVLGPSEPTAFGSLKAAFRRLPSLVITVGYLAIFNALCATLTVGLCFLFIGWNVVAYAVAMQGKGHALSLYGAASKALGASRASAVWVRLCLSVQALVMLNIHIAANVLIFLGMKLLAMDLSFAERFVSLDNGSWVAAVVALGFTLCEPLRAAAAALLLIDGRVRQEGLDLVAAIDQLPARRARKPSQAAQTAAAAVLLASGALFAFPARAQPEGGQLESRLAAVARYCGMSGSALQRQLEAASELGPRDRSALSRFVSEVESFAYDEEDCDYAEARLEQGLPLIVQARDGARAGEAADARERAKSILARPEFRPTPEKVEELEEPKEPEAPAEPGWWASLKKWWDDLWGSIGDWLRKLFKSKRSSPREVEPTIPIGGGLAAANLLVVLLVAAVVVALAYLLIRSRRGRSAEVDGAELTGIEEAKLTTDPMSALSRPPEGWAHLADELAARGDFREAVRSLYLALLSRLHRSGSIDYDPAKSNWDYLRGFRGRSEWVPPFRELTRRFDFTYYGNLGADLDGYHSFRSLTRPLLAPDPDERGAEAAHA
ncbi:MAG: DUF4129 domain-containing protein [Myxococcales bacterium]|nr:DUF4129 domain-containing protein [Myxococcales bacterium]